MNIAGVPRKGFANQLPVIHPLQISAKIDFRSHSLSLKNPKSASGNLLGCLPESLVDQTNSPQPLKRGKFTSAFNVLKPTSEIRIS
jgi:hypothetical protein